MQEKYAFVDVDVSSARERHFLAASFVRGTSIKYGLSSNDLRKLGGSELPRVAEFFEMDHDWSGDITLERSQSRLILKLFTDKCPLACENFWRLCQGKEKDPKQTFRGCKWHRVVSGFIAQTGDFVFGNGTGGESVFPGRKFKDEKPGLQLSHDRRGVLSMGNSGKNSNTSQWFLTFGPAKHLDGKHVVFGELISGFDCLSLIESAGSEAGEPTKSITVSECGEWIPGQPGCGYWYDIPDPESFSGRTPVFMAMVRVALVTPNAMAAQRFQQSLKACQVIDVENNFERAKNLLKSNAIDVVLVAFACADLAKDRHDPNVLIAKPPGALEAIRAWATSQNWDVCWDELTLR